MAKKRNPWMSREVLVADQSIPLRTDRRGITKILLVCNTGKVCLVGKTLEKSKKKEKQEKKKLKNKNNKKKKKRMKKKRVERSRARDQDRVPLQRLDQCRSLS